MWPLIICVISMILFSCRKLVMLQRIYHSFAPLTSYGMLQHLATFLHQCLSFLSDAQTTQLMARVHDSFALGFVLRNTENCLKDGRQIMRCTYSAIGSLDGQCSQHVVQCSLARCWKFENRISGLVAEIRLADVEFMAA